MSSDNDQQDEQAEWVAIANYSTVFEADMARQILDREGIPVLVSSNASGVFGAGFGGSVTGGVTLQVPSPIVEEALLLLGGGASDELDATP